MKLFNKIIFGLALCFSLSACEDWLDVNTNPNTPVSSDAKYYQRLPWMQFYMEHIYHITSSNTSFYCGDFYRNNGREGGAAKWQLGSSTRAVNAQQWFFTCVGSNCKPLYDQAMEAGAFHYAGAAKMIRAYGFMMLTELFGEIPYNDAFGANPSPVYDDGRTIYLGCLADIDEAIELFQKQQETVNGVPAAELALGDSWNGGDAQKWLKMCYMLKARWLNNLNKKQPGPRGSYKEGKYDAEEILACIEKAQKSNADNTAIPHEDKNTLSHDILGWNEPVDYNAMYSCIGMNSNIYVTKSLVDNLTKTVKDAEGNFVEDPRANKIIPWVRSSKSANSPADLVWSKDGKWRRSVGVDMQSDILSKQGPYAASFNANTLNWYCDSPTRQGDTIYVWTTCGGTGYAGGVDILYRRNSKHDESMMSGMFYGRADAPALVASYSEACFIKAETLYRKGNLDGAKQACKEGMIANMKFMEDQTAKWATENEALKEIPTFQAHSAEEMEAYAAAVVAAKDFDMGTIMTQKKLSMPLSNQNWVDMRRNDYNRDLYRNWDIPQFYYDNPTGQKYCPLGKYPRRWKQASFELNYNTKNLEAIGAKVPGAAELGEGWYNHDLVRTIPTWWDSDQE